MSLRQFCSLCVVSLAAANLGACAFLPKFGAKDAPVVPAAAESERQREFSLDERLAIAQDDDYVVRIIAGEVTCSGTLIEEDRVLTAHHCVAARNKYNDILPKDVEPDEIRVELGGDYLPWGEVGVRAVVAPPCGYAAGPGDLAILVLERRLIGVATLPPRLDRAPKVGEAIKPVGFGRCALSADGVRRHQRLGGHVSNLDTHRFKLSAAICPGDSGGPAVSENGEVLGVISASVMDGIETTRGRSEFTRLDSWRPVFATAKLIAEGTDPAELPPLACPAN